MAQRRNSAPASTEETPFAEIYERSTFLEEISSKYGGDASGWTSITLGRKDSTGKYPFLQNYLEPPTLEEIQKKYGGGDYRLFLQWTVGEKVPGEDNRHIDTKYFLIAGPPKNPWDETPAAAAQVQNTNGQQLNGAVQNPAAGFSMMDVMNMATKIVEISNTGRGGGGDMAAIATIMSKSMESNATMMTTMITAVMGVITQGKATGPESEKLTELLAKALIGKAGDSDLSNALKIVDQINERTQATGGDDSLLGSIAKVALPMLTGGAGGPQGDPAGVPPWAAGLMGEIKNGFAALDTKITGIEQRVLNIENNVEWETPGTPAGEKPPAADTNVIEIEPANVQDKNNNQQQQQPFELTEEQVLAERASAAALKNSPDIVKVSMLKEYLKSFSVEQIYNWCIEWDAVAGSNMEEKLTEYNRILKLAGMPEFVPPAVPGTA